MIVGTANAVNGPCSVIATDSLYQPRPGDLLQVIDVLTGPAEPPSQRVGQPEMAVHDLLMNSVSLVRIAALCDP